MSSESADLLWNASIHELKRLVQEEEEKQDGAKPASINDAFNHYATLYIRYTILLGDLNKCHDLSVQPQKRLDIKSSLEHVIYRVINLRHLLAKWCPPNQDVLSKGAAQVPFPWDYLDINKQLRDLSIPPSKLETAAPVFFKEDCAESTRHRNTTVTRLLEEKFGSEPRPLEVKNWLAESLTRAVMVGHGPESDGRESLDATGSDDKDGGASMSAEEAVTKIQSTVRGHLSRKKTTEARKWIDSFVGLSGPDDMAALDNLESTLDDIRHQRKQEQLYCKESYESDLVRLREVVREEEGFDMKNELREERIQWITEHTVKNSSLPDSFEGFYASKAGSQEDEENDNDPSAAKGKDVKVAKDGKKPKDKKSSEAEEIERPALAPQPALLNPLKNCISVYEKKWERRSVGPERIKSQYPDADMAKDLIIRDQVRSELTVEVEEKLLSNVLKIKAMQDANTKKSKSKKDGKGKKKSKGKKAGGKKEKPLPGAKLPGMKEMGVDDMLGILVQNGLVHLPEDGITVGDFIGGFECQSPEFPDTDKQERWIPNDPSAFQLRKTVMEYCILPLGSELIKSNMQDDENIRSLLLYGPEGSGKTHTVRTIASEIGALLINLSSSTIGNSFGGKEGATKLIHMVFTVARERLNAPVIIYLDDCHEFFMGKSKKGKRGQSSSGINTEMQRFQKDLLIYKNLALKKEDRVIVIGCTNTPELGDVKLMRWKGPTGKPEKQGFFERSLYFPRACHADRALLWKAFIRRRISGFSATLKVPDVDYASLAFLSEGFNAGEILSTVDSVLSDDRLETLASGPLSELEFSRYFARDMNKQGDMRFLTFTRQITNLDSVWKSINAVDKKEPKKKK